MSRRNKIMHRTIQGIILIIWLPCIGSFMYSVFQVPSKSFTQEFFEAFWNYGWEYSGLNDIHIVPTSLKWHYFLATLFSMFGFLIFLLWAFRIRKIAREEKIFKKNIKKLRGELARLKEKGLISEDEEELWNEKKTSLFLKFLNRFSSNKRRNLEYKIERLSILKEEGFILEEEFKQGKEKLIQEK